MTLHVAVTEDFYRRANNPPAPRTPGSMSTSMSLHFSGNVVVRCCAHLFLALEASFVGVRMRIVLQWETAESQPDFKQDSSPHFAKNSEKVFAFD